MKKTWNCLLVLLVILGLVFPVGAPAEKGVKKGSMSDLPQEAEQTLALIQSGGPFPFGKDGTTFQNREKLLPKQKKGYYKEYTVITPGKTNRGKRRIVTGKGGEIYYTKDHYKSFIQVK